MDTLNKFSGILAVVAIGLAIFAVLNAGPSFGSVGTRFPNGLAVGTTATVTQNKLTIGNSGTALGNVIYGTGTGFPLIVTSQAAYTQAASTTQPYDIAVAGLVAGCTVNVTYATSTATLIGAQWPILGVKASTTAAFATVVIANYTGTAANPSVTGIASSTNVVAICP